MVDKNRVQTLTRVVSPKHETNVAKEVFDPKTAAAINRGIIDQTSQLLNQNVDLTNKSQNENNNENNNGAQNRPGSST